MIQAPGPGNIFSVTEAHDEEEDRLDTNILTEPSVVSGEDVENEDAMNEQDEEMLDIGNGASGEAGDGVDLAGQGPQPFESQPEIDVQLEGLKYWVGWLASRFTYRYRELNLGRPTSSYVDPGSQPPAWINRISMGGLTVASDEFMALVGEFEKDFVAVHGNTLSFDETGAIKKVEDQIRTNHPEVGFQLIKAFSRGRVFLRQRFLNFRRKEINAEEKRLKNRHKRVTEGGDEESQGSSQRPKKTNQGGGMPSAAQARNIRKRRDYQ